MKSLSFRWLPPILLALGLAAHFTRLLTSPPGINADAARVSLYTLDFLRRNVWPFYIYQHFAPTPLISYLQAPVFLVFGFNNAAMRGLTTFAAALGVPAAYLASRELFAERGDRFARRAGLAAALGLAFFPFWTMFSRHGLELTLLPLAELMAVAALWRGLRRNSLADFCLAGVVLGLSQYTYVVARAFPVAFGGACLAALLADRRWLTRWRGLALTASTAALIALPQWLLFIQAPYTFFARTEQSAGRFIFAVPNAWAIIGGKLLNQLLMLGWHWHTDYNFYSDRPWLNPVLLLGFALAIISVRRSRQAGLKFTLIIAAIMFLPDLFTYEKMDPSASRLTGAMPFVFILAGMGCASVWEWLPTRIGSLVLAAVLTAGIEGQWDFTVRVMPQVNANPGLEWQASLVEIAEAKFIAAHRDSPILVTASEYQRVPLAFLLAEYFPNRAGGAAPPLSVGEAVTVVAPVSPERATSEGIPAGYIPDQWVLLKNGVAYFLPPLPGGVQSTGDPQTIFASNGALAATVFPTRWSGAPPTITPVTASFENGLDLVGYHAAELAPGQPVTVTLYWRRRQSLPADVQLFTQILDRNGNAIAAIHDWPLHGVYRVRAWQQDEVMPLSYTLNIPPNASPGPYRLIAGVFDILRHDRVPLQTGEDAATVATLKLPLPATNAQPAQLFSAKFGDTIQLSGYTLTPAAGGLQLDLFWQATATPDFDYTVFVHVVNANGEIVAQSDSQPLNGQYPTSIWSPGEIVVDERFIRLVPGTHQIFVGLYRWDTGERLHAVIDGERAADDRLLLQEIVIR